MRERRAGVEDDLYLGKAPPKRYYGDVRVKLADFIDPDEIVAGLPSTPHYWGWATKPGVGQYPSNQIPLYLNNALPCCTVTTVGHTELIQSWRSEGTAEVLQDEWIREMFHDTGIEQGLSDSQGRYLQGVLSYWARRGMRQADGNYERILGYAAVDVANWTEVEAAGYLFGGMQLGIALPMTALYQIRNGLNWSYTSYSGYSQSAGSWGGHAVYMSARNYRGPLCFTWGKRQQMTKAFWDHYLDEAYVIIGPDWAGDTRGAPSGFDVRGLVNLLEELNR